MADLDDEAIAALRKKRQFKKFTFRGIELDKLLDLSHEELLNYVHARYDYTSLYSELTSYYNIL